jgi:hypothetical protein
MESNYLREESHEPRQLEEEMGKETEEKKEEVRGTHRKSLKESGLPLLEAGPDDPIYRRGWTVGGTSLKRPHTGSQEVKEKESADNPSEKHKP